MATAPILAGDIKLLASKTMDDVPNGGGGPTGNAIPDGANNAIFSDVTERQRAVGGVSIRQLFGAVQTPSTDAYMDPTVVLSQLPNDPNVSITLAKTSMFAKRTEIANAIENYLIASSEWGGFLLENHVAGQRSIQLLQRPGMPTPAIGRTLVLVQSEGLPAQVMQYVRVTKVEVAQRTFTYTTGSGLVDYVADVVDCTLSDVLRSNFAGSVPSRYYTREPLKTVVRDTTVADAATFYGAAALTAAGSIGDSLLRVFSVYTQLVPSARTEVVALDQKPGAQRTIVLADTPRRVEVGVTPHTQRIKIGQENRSLNYVFMLRPLPAPGTIVVSFRVLGNWYTAYDDGAGAFSGSAAGQVIYTTGSMAITLPALPDVGSSVLISFGERVGFDNRSSQSAAVRAPEYCWMLEEEGVVPGSIVITWYSAGVLRTAQDNGLGNFTGDGAGVIDYPSNTVLLRPAHLPDPGGQLNIAYTTDLVHTELFPPSPVTTPDAGGFVLLTLAQQPAAGTLAIAWATARQVSNTGGGSQTTTTAVKNANVTYTTRSVPEFYTPGSSVSSSGGGGGGSGVIPGGGGSYAPNWPKSTPGPG